MYYQFVLVVSGDLPMTMRTRYRSLSSASKRLSGYVRAGVRGCMVTMDASGLLDSQEF